MALDIIFFILMMLAIYKGYSKGMVSTLFSFLAIVIGLVIAFKFSAVVATWLQTSTNISTYWLPFLSFIIIMIAIIIIAKITTGIIEKIFQLAMLGWLNKLLGILIYVSLYMIVLSGFLFFLEKMTILKSTTLNNSNVYSIVQPIAPKMIAVFGKVLPFVKESLQQLESFFKVSTVV
ncbi:MAG: CvpA family protein [Chitinophagaceae bacterium]|nr:CvpA family protein [Chitinophagaceae bacterium]